MVFTRTAIGLDVTGTSPAGRSQTSHFDLHGHVLQSVPAPGAAGLLPTSYEYDAEGRLSRAVQGTREMLVGYIDADVGAPASGQPERGYARGVRDGLGQWSRYEHDPLGRRTLTERRDGTSLSPN